jgi:hypothetical protein
LLFLLCDLFSTKVKDFFCRIRVLPFVVIMT